MKRSSKPKRQKKRPKATVAVLSRTLDITERVHAAAIAACDKARKLPGLYIVQADGRPGFTSQAAADLCNALSEFDAARSGTTPRTNAVPRGSVSIKPSKENT